MNSSSSNDNNGGPISAAALPGQAVDIERDVSRPVSRNEDSSINGTDPSSAIDLEKTAGETAQPSSSKEVQYSVFPRNQKYFIVFMASLGSFFSPLSANIYFPALNTLASHYNVTPSMINLTITTYQICQGLAPSVYGDFSDQAGRRPAFIVAFVIYVAANIGLAVQNSYASLMVLRCLQSSGSSGTIALSLGIIADVTTTAERGTYMGLALSGAMLASAIGPIIGGLLTQFLGWRAIFWFLTIFSGSYTLIYIILMPETNRTIVGNGSVAPREWWNMSGIDMLRLRKLRRNETKEARELRESLPKNKVRWPRPWTSLQVMKEKDVAAVLFFNSIVNCAFYDVIATTPLQFERLYGYNSVQIGLCYL
jgi:multidrug resistance protein